MTTFAITYNALLNCENTFTTADAIKKAQNILLHAHLTDFHKSMRLAAERFIADKKDIISEKKRTVEKLITPPSGKRPRLYAFKPTSTKPPLPMSPEEVARLKDKEGLSFFDIAKKFQCTAKNAIDAYNRYKGFKFLGEKVPYDIYPNQKINYQHISDYFLTEYTGDKLPTNNDLYKFLEGKQLTLKLSIIKEVLIIARKTFINKKLGFV